MSDRIAAVCEVNQPRRPISTIPTTGKPTGNFLAMILDKSRQVGPQSRLYEVRQGDTLSGICKDFLAEGNQPTTGANIHAAVEQVAQANHLKSPDRIYVGQKIDLGSISSSSVNKLAQGGRGTPWRPSANGLKEVLGLLKREITNESPSSEIKSLAIVDSGEVTSKFGMRLNPFTGQPEHHEGVDFAASRNTAIHAVMPGTVIFSGWQSGYGKTVIIRHTNGCETLYAHNSVNLVKPGEQVEAKTPIAKVGSTGNSTGSHVHFELRRNGCAVDPETIGEKQSVQVTQAFHGLNVVF